MGPACKAATCSTASFGRAGDTGATADWLAILAATSLAGAGADPAASCAATGPGVVGAAGKGAAAAGVPSSGAAAGGDETTAGGATGAATAGATPTSCGKGAEDASAVAEVDAADGDGADGTGASRDGVAAAGLDEAGITTAPDAGAAAAASGLASTGLKLLTSATSASCDTTIGPGFVGPAASSATGTVASLDAGATGGGAWMPTKASLACGTRPLGAGGGATANRTAPTVPPASSAAVATEAPIFRRRWLWPRGGAASMRPSASAALGRSAAPCAPSRWIAGGPNFASAAAPSKRVSIRPSFSKILLLQSLRGWVIS
jgi:hypothetical protein